MTMIARSRGDRDLDVTERRRAEAIARLQQQRELISTRSMSQLFCEDPYRFSNMSIKASGIFLDYSKIRIDRVALKLLLNLADICGVSNKRDQIFSGARVNTTEGRPALHMALRAQRDANFSVDGKNVMGDVHEVLDRVCAFSNDVRSGELKSADGSTFSDVVCIGIGGSDLGPRLAVRALKPYHDGPRVHFVSNVDGAHLYEVIQDVPLSTTLFIVASKTFNTTETMRNAESARDILIGKLGSSAVSKHFVAISTNTEAVKAFGVSASMTFDFWDWVGGRFSVWSAIGLPLAIAIGEAGFREFLDGANKMDEHFRTSPLVANMPLIMALIGIWHRNIWGFQSVAVLPYEQRLELLPAYLQQLEMESNGKSVGANGSVVDQDTCPVIWGATGNNGQHAFFQFLHQGTSIVPCEFMVGTETHHSYERHQDLLLANCFAQSEALMKGRTEDTALQEMLRAGVTPGAAVRLAPHKAFSGNRPSTTLLYRRLDPTTLGSLIALYEHKVFVQGVLWGVNSFDQWGVELGKSLATRCEAMLQRRPYIGEVDASTRGLINTARRWRN